MGKTEVYLIKRRSKKGKPSYYTGISKDSDRRYKEHHKKGSNKGYDLWGKRVISQFDTRKGATGKEKEIKKSWSSAKKKRVYDREK